MLKDCLVLGHLVFTQQEKQVHHHQPWAWTLSLIESRKAKRDERWWWTQSPSYSPVFLGHHAGETVGTHSAFSPCWKTLHEAQVFLLERETNICKFYFVWDAVRSPWKCGCPSFSHYFVESVTSQAIRESESKHLTSGHGEMQRKFHLQLELGSGI